MSAPRLPSSRFLVVAGLLLGLGAGCASVGPLPEVDLLDPGWSVQTGQAVWKRDRESRPLAGELIIASHQNGNVLVSFSKPPVPIFTAQTDGPEWRIDLVRGGRSFSGRGKPPKRFVWFRLPQLLAGEEPPKRWSVEPLEAGEWLLSNARRGETIRLVLDPESP